MSKKLYAIGFKDWVEVRIAQKPPVYHKSEVEREVEVEEPCNYQCIYDLNGMLIGVRTLATAKVKKKFKIPCHYHEGGIVICALTTRKFKALTGIHVGYGKMVEVPREIGMKIEQVKEKL